MNDMCFLSLDELPFESGDVALGTDSLRFWVERFRFGEVNNM
jgi:hypothetical protein